MIESDEATSFSSLALNDIKTIGVGHCLNHVVLRQCVIMVFVEFPPKMQHE